MIPRAIERNYPKRLLQAGWWHMSLFQQLASDPNVCDQYNVWPRTARGLVIFFGSGFGGGCYLKKKSATLSWLFCRRCRVNHCEPLSMLRRNLW